MRLGRSPGLELLLWGFFITALPREVTAFAAGIGPDLCWGAFRLVPSVPFFPFAGIESRPAQSAGAATRDKNGME